ncbi:MAG TPA: tetraacyldisaccharide 4'-kinase, partial [Pasteurellaceae bacterium]|nr:tetraacyldisaccharide 4'-kinase [Pasteurellaceae bacterium]
CNALMTLVAKYAVNLVTGEQRALTDFNNVSAIAGIGNPQRFFTMLQTLGIRLTKTRAFQDHQAFSTELFTEFDKNEPLFMTEKDAVKCTDFACDNWWYVPVEAKIDGEKATELLARISEIKNER